MGSKKPNKLARHIKNQIFKKLQKGIVKKQINKTQDTVQLTATDKVTFSYHYNHLSYNSLF